VCEFSAKRRKEVPDIARFAEKCLSEWQKGKKNPSFPKQAYTVPGLDTYMIIVLTLIFK